MTRAEFDENITEWCELIEFCYDNDCDICEDVYDEDARDSYIDEHLMDMVDNCRNWSDLLDTLSDIPTEYSYYELDIYGGWAGLDDNDFNRYKEEILEWGDENDIWDNDGDEETYDEEEEPTPHRDEADENDDFDELAEEPLSLSDLFSGCAQNAVQIIKLENEEEKSYEQAIEWLLTTAEASC